MKPAARRQLVTQIRQKHELSEKRACGLVGITRWINRYQSRRDTQDELRMRLREMAASRVRYGYRRLTVLLRREGCAVNAKRVYRLYCEEGLQVRTASLWIQCAGIAALIDWGLAYLARKQRLSQMHSTVLMVRVTSLMIGLDIAQILVRAGFYRWMCFPRWGSAFFFSIASYSTIGDGDFVLPATWRSLSPVEAVTGVLMCGLSVSLLFAIVTRLVDRIVRPSQIRAERPREA